MRQKAFFKLFLPAFCLFFNHISVIALHNVFKEIDSLACTSERWLLKEEKTLSDIVLQKNDMQHFRFLMDNIKKFSDKLKKSSKIGKKEGRFYKNRNNHRLPFDENRTGREIPGFYLSASDVVTPEQDYIVSQGPMQHTMREFWMALLKKGSSLIVTATMANEKGSDKCYPYWQRNAQRLMVDDWIVSPQCDERVIIASQWTNQRIVQRTFRATKMYGTGERTIYQLHYENWNDGWIPEKELFEVLLDEMDLYSSPRIPILVHCSAGVGRSGMIVAAHSLRRYIRIRSNSQTTSSILLNIPKRICALRLQRDHMIGTPHQLQFVYKVLGRSS